MSKDTVLLPEKKKPDWLRIKLPIGKEYTELRRLVNKYKLNMICISRDYQNMGECGRRNNSFLWLLWCKNRKTRSCSMRDKPEKVRHFKNYGNKIRCDYPCR